MVQRSNLPPPQPWSSYISIIFNQNKSNISCFCFHSFHCSFHFPYVCVCFHAIPCNILLILFMFLSFFQFISFSCMFLSFSRLPPLPPFSQCQPANPAVKAPTHKFACFGHEFNIWMCGHIILTLVTLFSFPVTIFMIK